MSTWFVWCFSTIVLTPSVQCGTIEKNNHTGAKVLLLTMKASSFFHQHSLNCSVDGKHHQFSSRNDWKTQLHKSELNDLIPPWVVFTGLLAIWANLSISSIFYSSITHWVHFLAYEILLVGSPGRCRAALNYYSRFLHIRRYNLISWSHVLVRTGYPTRQTFQCQKRILKYCALKLFYHNRPIEMYVLLCLCCAVMSYSLII